MLIWTLQSEDCLYVISFRSHDSFMKDESDAIIVPIYRQRDLGKLINLHPQAHSKSVMEQGHGHLHAAPPLPRILIQKEKGSLCFPWRSLITQRTSRVWPTPGLWPGPPLNFPSDPHTADRWLGLSPTEAGKIGWSCPFETGRNEVPEKARA